MKQAFGMGVALWYCCSMCWLYSTSATPDCSASYIQGCW